LISIKFDEYHFPTLLELPHLYSDLFSYYSTKKCTYCSKIPKETGICLLCGVQFCYKNHYCCDSMKEFNKKHLNFCGAQTLVLLNINSTYVFVIRGKRCAPWASLYLDDHGEEDRDLRY
jgi:E3 ubiquitin-protein ligase UBR3